MKYKLITTLFAASFYFCPIIAQDDGNFGSIKNIEEVDAGLGLKNKEVEFYEKGNNGYNEVLRKYQNYQRSNSRNSGVYEYRSGGIQVDRTPPSWAKTNPQSKSRQTAIRNRQIRNAQIEKHNQEIREHNRMIEEQRRQDEERREAERREKDRNEQQRQYNIEYDRVMRQSTGRFNRQVDFALQQRENMQELRNTKIDNLSARSGYIPSEGEAIASQPRQRTSLAGIVSKGGKPSATGLDIHAVPITMKQDDAYNYNIVSKGNGDPLGNAKFYAEKGGGATSLGKKMYYQSKSTWAMSEEIAANSRKWNQNTDFEKRINQAVLEKQKKPMSMVGATIPKTLGEGHEGQNNIGHQNAKNSSIIQKTQNPGQSGRPTQPVQQDFKKRPPNSSPSIDTQNQKGINNSTLNGSKEDLEVYIKKREMLRQRLQQLNSERRN